MHITEAGIQTAATWLLLIGALVGGYGLLHAWNRVTGQLDKLRKGIEQLRNTVVSDLDAAAREYIPNRPHQGGAQGKFGWDSTAKGEVGRSGTVEERLHRVENELARLPGQLTKEINAAIASAFEGFRAQEKIFGVKDKSWALGGAVIALSGTVLRLLDQSSVFPK